MFVTQNAPEVSVGLFKNHLGEPLFVASGMVIGTVEEVSKMLDTYKEGEPDTPVRSKVIKLETVAIQNAFHGALQAAADMSGIDFKGLASDLRWLQFGGQPTAAQDEKAEIPASPSHKGHSEAEWNKYLSARIKAFGRWMEGEIYDGPDVRIASEIRKLDEVFGRKNPSLDEPLKQGANEKSVGCNCGR